MDFAREVAPLLQRYCLRCHQPANRKGDLSLAAFADLKEGGYVAPRKPDDSPLLALVSSAGRGKRPRMPKEGKPLSASEVGVLRR